MNRWDALTTIVKAFIDKGSPGYAFGTVCIVGRPLAIGAGALLLKLVH